MCYGEVALDVDKDNMVLHRDRVPDRDWGELRRGRLDLCKEVEANPELITRLVEDLAFAYGQNTKLFKSKLEEFGISIGMSKKNCN